MACSDKWKIDKIDKLFICLLLIFICLFEFCNTFVFADFLGQYCEWELVPNLAVNFDSNNFYSIDNENSVVSYYQLVPGNEYVFYNTSSSNCTLRLCSEVPRDLLPFRNFVEVSANSSYSFVAGDNSYIYITTFTKNGGTELILNNRFLYDVTSAFDNSIGSLVDNVGVSQLWGIFDISVNYIVVVVLFVIGVYIIFSFIKKGSRGKSGF